MRSKFSYLIYYTIELQSDLMSLEFKNEEAETALRSCTERMVDILLEHTGDRAKKTEYLDYVQGYSDRLIILIQAGVDVLGRILVLLLIELADEREVASESPFWNHEIHTCDTADLAALLDGGEEYGVKFDISYLRTVRIFMCQFKDANAVDEILKSKMLKIVAWLTEKYRVKVAGLNEEQLGKFWELAKVVREAVEEMDRKILRKLMGGTGENELSPLPDSHENEEPPTERERERTVGVARSFQALSFVCSTDPDQFMNILLGKIRQNT